MKNQATAIKFLPILVLTALFSCGNETNSDSENELAAESEQELIERAKIIHDQTITLDTHADINSQNFTLDVNYTMNLDTQVNLVKMEAGKLDAAWFIVYTAQSTLDDEGYKIAYENAIDKFEAIHLLADQIAPDEIELAYTSDDVRRIAKTGKKVAMIGIENAYPIALDLSNIKDFHDRGGRYMSLAHNGHSQFADSHTGDADGIYLHNGLSELGRQAIEEMNRWGIIVDISHPSKESILQMLDLTQAPVIASHSSARELTNHTRNLDNETLLRIKENGGVVQTVAFGSYINEDRRQYLERAANDESLSRDEAPKATVSDFVDHIDFLVNLIGVEHVGIASDFDGGGGIEGWNDASETFNVTLELVRRGYSEENIKAIWSGNLLRVLDDVQRIAGEIQQR
ncbi:MAG: peptidase M19 [Deltaproteobacteria bacterium]|jgi:membrane dipeptidase|nr:peptidase M19 [Deltaproteobacteria bacterium]|tara:strand:- start:2203 stop:3405 length:1203 start_codon:yes stop_codon:yes gene_type:complete